MRNEIKVGILAVVSIGLLIWGYTYLKGKNLFSSVTSVYATYQSVESLSKSDPIYLSGYKVGIVGDIAFTEDYSNLVVRLDLRSDLQLPKSTTAAIVNISVMGEKGIRLVVDEACPGDCLATGDKVEGIILGYMGAAKETIDPYLEKMEGGFNKIDSIVKSMTTGDGGGGNSQNDFAKTVTDFQSLISNLSNTSGRLDRVLASSSSDIQGSLSDVNGITSTLNNNSGNIDKLMQSLTAFSDQLAKLDLAKTMATTEKSIEELTATIAKVEKTLNGVDGLLAKISNGNGTVGKLMNEDETYTQLNKTLRDLDLLLVDVRLNPKRYIRLNNKEIPYNPDQVDPADAKKTGSINTVPKDAVGNKASQSSPSGN